MVGGIDQEGKLFIMRPRPQEVTGFREILCSCPFRGHSFCGDSCPAFQEPRGSDDGQECTLTICSGDIVFSGFVDRRLTVPAGPGRADLELTCGKCGHKKTGTAGDIHGTCDQPGCGGVMHNLDGRD